MTESDKIAIYAAIASTIVGLISLVISILANRTSQKAQRLAEEAHFAEKRISLKSERGPDGLLLAAAGEDREINNVTIYFPGKLDIPPIALAASNLILHDEKVQNNLKDYWDSMTPIPERGKSAKRNNVPIPLVAVVLGHTKGVASMTTGLYDLYSTYIRSDKGESSLTVLSVALNNYDVSGRDPQTIVDGILRDVEVVIFG